MFTLKTFRVPVQGRIEGGGCLNNPDSLSGILFEPQVTFIHLHFTHFNINKIY